MAASSWMLLMKLAITEAGSDITRRIGVTASVTAMRARSTSTVSALPISIRAKVMAISDRNANRCKSDLSVPKREICPVGCRTFWSSLS